MAIRDIINKIRFGSSKPTNLERQMNMSIAGNQFTRTTGAGLTRPGVNPRTANIVRNIAPAVVTALPGGQTRQATGLLSKAGRFVTNVFNPFSFNKGAFAQRAVTSTAVTVGSNIFAKSQGADVNIFPTSNQLLGSTAYTVGGLPAFIGGTYLTAKSGLKKGKSNVVDVFQSFSNPVMTPNNPITGPLISRLGKKENELLGIGRKQPTFIDNPQLPGPLAENFAPSPQLSASYGVSGPSLSVGGGGFDPTLLLLLLSGGLLGGYALGKRKKKRKTKKSKKRRRSKK